MDLRRILLVLLVIAVVLTSSFFFLGYDETVKYKRVGLTNTSSIEIPISDASTSSVINGGINLINDTKHDLSIMYFNSGDGNQVAAVELEYLRNDFVENSVQENIDNKTIWHNEENGTYMGFIGNYVTHDNILIVCKDPEMLMHILNSARYQYFNEETNTTETMQGENESAAEDQTVSLNNNATSNETYDATAPASNGTSQSSDVPEGYYWSGQDSDYIREYDDAKGIHHIDRRNGPNEAIDPVNNKHWTDGVEDTEAYNNDFN